MLLDDKTFLIENFPLSEVIIHCRQCLDSSSGFLWVDSVSLLIPITMWDNRIWSWFRFHSEMPSIFNLLHFVFMLRFNQFGDVGDQFPSIFSLCHWYFNSIALYKLITTYTLINKFHLNSYILLIFPLKNSKFPILVSYPQGINK